MFISPFFPEIFSFLLAVELLGFLALPFTFFYLTRLKDRGYLASKAIGILIFCYLTWVIAYSPIGYNIYSLALALFVLAALCVYFYLRDPKALKEFLRKEKKTIIISEILFLLSFFIFLIIRMHNPEIVNLEKFYDYALINGIARSPAMPPIDPWLSPSSIHYYYFGHFIVATLGKLSMVPTNYSFNLALALLFALTASLAYSLGYNLTKRRLYGLVALALVCLIGNASILLWAMDHTQMDINALWFSTRLIPNTINEYPFASFLFGELHAHYISFPFQMLLLIILLDINYSEKKGLFVFGDNPKDSIIRVFFFSLFLGSMSFMNSWAYPTYALLFAVFLLGKEFAFGIPFDYKSFLFSLFSLFIVCSLSILLYMPYHLSNPPERTIGYVVEKTPIIPFIIFFFPFLFILCLFIAKEYKNVKRKKFTVGWVLISLLLFEALLYATIILRTPILPVTLLLALIPAGILIRGIVCTESYYALVLTSFGAMLTLFTDVFYISSRTDTVFKYYLQTWFFWAVACAYGLYVLREQINIHTSKKKRRFIYAACLCLVIITSSLLPCLVLCNYLFSGVPFFGAVNYVPAGSQRTMSLDGIDYMKTAREQDYNAIKWINDNIRTSGTILEKPGKSFSYESRVSANTGLPTVIGWQGHEYTLRLIWYQERTNDVDTIYQTLENEKALSLLKKYNVSYVYIGLLERSAYPEDGLKKFSENPQYYTPIYDNLSTTIYRVNQ